ncbi:MAG: hypothetical protein II304_10795 [Bacteroidales bacterium]|nr:hypothetical protein [Bacteroidales bacterium]
MENRKFVFSVGCGDAWLSYTSLTPIAIATTREKAIELIAQHAENNEIELTDYDLYNLKEIGQTQGKDTNYIIDLIELDTLL